MGWVRAMSAAISRTTRCCAAVREKGRAASNWLDDGCLLRRGLQGRRGQAERLAALGVLRELLGQQLLGLEALPGGVAVVLQGIERHLRAGVVQKKQRFAQA